MKCIDFIVYRRQASFFNTIYNRLYKHLKKEQVR